jgi:hypothetical protein
MCRTSRRQYAIWSAAESLTLEGTRPAGNLHEWCKRRQHHRRSRPLSLGNRCLPARSSLGGPPRGLPNARGLPVHLRRQTWRWPESAHHWKELRGDLGGGRQGRRGALRDPRARPGSRRDPRRADVERVVVRRLRGHLRHAAHTRGRRLQRRGGQAEEGGYAGGRAALGVQGAPRHLPAPRLAGARLLARSVSPVWLDRASAGRAHQPR